MVFSSITSLIQPLIGHTYKWPLIFTIALSTQVLEGISQRIKVPNGVYALNEQTIEYYHLLAEDNDNNICFSPVSLLKTLKAVEIGTLPAIGSELRTQVTGLTELNNYTEDFQKWKELSSKKNDDLVLETNAMVYQAGIRLSTDFVSEMASKRFVRPIRTDLQIGKNKSIERINDLIYERSNHRTTGFLDSLDIPQGSPFFTFSSVSAESNWQAEFPLKDSKVGKFFGKANTANEVTYMKGSGTYFFFEDDIVDIIEIPFSGKRFSLLIFLSPDIQGFESLLLGENYHLWTSRLWATRFRSVEIPKVKLTGNHLLKRHLEDMEVTKPFKPTPYFRKMTSYEPMFIEEIFHHAELNLSEFGQKPDTTSFRALRQSVKPPTKTLRIDRPFFYVVKSNMSELILLIGRFMHP